MYRYILCISTVGTELRTYCSAMSEDAAYSVLPCCTWRLADYIYLQRYNTAISLARCATGVCRATPFTRAHLDAFFGQRVGHATHPRENYRAVTTGGADGFRRLHSSSRLSSTKSGVVKFLWPQNRLLLICRRWTPKLPVRCWCYPQPDVFPLFIFSPRIIETNSRTLVKIMRTQALLETGGSL